MSANPSTEHYGAIRALVTRDACHHDWVCVEGATLCCQCGADLDKILSDVRKLSDPYEGGVRKAVTVDADQQMEAEPHVPSLMNALRTLPEWLVGLALIAGGIAGWLVVR